LTLLHLNPKNGDHAAFIAERQLSWFGKKMPRAFVKSILLEGLAILGDKFVIAPVADLIELIDDIVVLPRTVLPVTSTPRLALDYRSSTVSLVSC